MDDPLDAELVAGLRAGDEACFRTFFERHRASIRAAFLGMGASSDDADDLTQEVFTRALVGIGRLREDQKAAGWLFGIVRNLRLQYIRRAGRREAALVDSDQIPAADKSPLARYLDSEQQLAVQGALTELDESARELVRLRFAHGLSYKEIAAQLGTTVSNVGVKLHRLCGRLRAPLSPWGDPS